MGEEKQIARLTRALGGHETVGLDTCVFIYHFEAHPLYSKLTRPILEALEAGTFQGVISTITVTECLSKPYSMSNLDLAGMYQEAFLTWPNLLVEDVDFHVARSAAQLRGTLGLGTADSIVAATAMTAGGSLLITNDPDFKRIKDIQVLILDDMG